MKEKPKAFLTWLGDRFGRLMDPQFILGALILIAWLVFLKRPLGLLDKISLNDLATAKEQTALILTLAAGVSGLFTTALGFVLGHFFGKQGIESAEKRTTDALKEKEEVKDKKNRTLDEIGKDSTERIANLEENVMYILETVESIEAES